MRKSTGALLGGLLTLAAALGSYGCTPDVFTQDNSPVSLFITAINGGAPLDSDVITDEGAVFEDEVNVALANRAKNQAAPTPNIPMALFVERYEVRYIRSDGRGVEGVDVPFAIAGNVSFAVDVASSGTVDMPLEVVRRQAKLEPPLRNLRGGGGGAIVLTVFAEVTLHARTVAGQVTTATGRFQIDFADFGG